MLGRSRLETSRLGLGAMSFGSVVDAEQSHVLLDEALELGINLVDTANMYGTADRPHASEEIIGDWLAGAPARRERVVLATKVFEPTAAWPNHSGLSALNIRRACDASLKRLRTDYIDLFQMHHIDRDAPWDEIWSAMDILRQQGKIVYVGSSNFAGWHLATAQSAAERHGVPGLISEQSVYNLSRRDIEQEVVPAARYHGIGILAWSPLAGGLFAGDATGGVRSMSPTTRARRARFRGQLDVTARLSVEAGLDMTSLALAWLLRRPAVAAAMIGPRTPAQLRALAAASAASLDDALVAELDDIWPGPGEAPESYAW